jgi:hypothetical protein
MPIDPGALSALAADYAKGMTSIRGRRVQRLLTREFAGADHVLLMQVGADTAAVLGLSASGAAFCCTDGRGRQASILKWLHGSTEAVEAAFDLLKDSLPLLDAKALPLARLPGTDLAHLSPDSVPSEARALASRAIQALNLHTL